MGGSHKGDEARGSVPRDLPRPTSEGDGTIGSSADSEGQGEGHSHRIWMGRYRVAQAGAPSARLRNDSPQARQKADLGETFGL